MPVMYEMKHCQIVAKHLLHLERKLAIGCGLCEVKHFCESTILHVTTSRLQDAKTFLQRFTAQINGNNYWNDFV